MRFFKKYTVLVPAVLQAVLGAVLEAILEAARQKKHTVPYLNWSALNID